MVSYREAAWIASRWLSGCACPGCSDGHKGSCVRARSLFTLEEEVSTFATLPISPSATVVSDGLNHDSACAAHPHS